MLDQTIVNKILEETLLGTLSYIREKNIKETTNIRVFFSSTIGNIIDCIYSQVIPHSDDKEKQKLKNVTSMGTGIGTYTIKFPFNNLQNPTLIQKIKKTDEERGSAFVRNYTDLTVEIEKNTNQIVIKVRIVEEAILTYQNEKIKRLQRVESEVEQLKKELAYLKRKLHQLSPATEGGSNEFFQSPPELTREELGTQQPLKKIKVEKPKSFVSFPGT